MLKTNGCKKPKELSVDGNTIFDIYQCVCMCAFLEVKNIIIKDYKLQIKTTTISISD